MNYLTDPSIREMFVYLVLTVAAIGLPALVLLSPVIVGELIEIWRERGES